MCRPARCSDCGNTTWAGCGQHVDQVMARVPSDSRCACHQRSGGARAGRDRSSLLGRILGR